MIYWNDPDALSPLVVSVPMHFFKWNDFANPGPEILTFAYKCAVERTYSYVMSDTMYEWLLQQQMPFGLELATDKPVEVDPRGVHMVAPMFELGNIWCALVRLNTIEDAVLMKTVWG